MEGKLHALLSKQVTESKYTMNTNIGKIYSGAFRLRLERAGLPMLALIAFWTLTLKPLVQSGMMTCSHDGMLHLLRAFHLDAMARQGIWWPRWVPTLVFGYGCPLFNFYPALSLYPILILHRLGLSLLQSWNWTLALSILASGGAMYLWAQQVLGQRGAFIAAVAYMLAPYQLYEVYWRGSVSGALTWPLLPVVLWAALRVMQECRWVYALIGAVAYAAILLTNAPASLMFTLILVAYLFALMWGGPNRRMVACQLAGMMILGVGLAAFFLAPAFFERSQVQFWRASALGGVDFRKHFLSLFDLPGPFLASDPRLVNPSSPPRSLGWAICLLAGIGVLTAWWRRAHIGHAYKLHLIWAALTLIGAIVMTSFISEPIWSHAPLLSSFLPFIQFPWRFLGVATLSASLLVGLGVAVLDDSMQGGVLGKCLAPVALTMLAANTLPWAYPRLCPAPDVPDQAFFTAYEASAKLIGGATFSEYLPIAVQQVPTTSPMDAAMRAGQPVIRWDAPGARILASRDDGLRAELTLESDTSVQVIYRAFYFPGWQATLDDQPVDLQVTLPMGLMAVNIPAGRHVLTIRFGSTSLRTISEYVSLVVALLIIVIGAFDLCSTLHTSHSTVAVSARSACAATWLGLIVFGVALLVLKLAVVDCCDTPLRPSRLRSDGQLIGAMHPSRVVVAGQARLLGYDVRPERAVAGDVAVLALYWTLDGVLDFGATVRLLDEQGLEWSYKSEPYEALGGYNGPPPSRYWLPHTYADDRHAMRILPGTPPGDYLLVVVPYNPETTAPLPISAGQTAPAGYPGAVIGKLQITAPTRPPPVDTLELAVRADVQLGVDLTLLGYSQDREQVAAGQVMRLTLGWQARQKPQKDYMLRLELVAPDGQTVTQLALAPGGAQYPTSRWAAGEIIRTQAMVRIPGRAQSGQYTWRAVLFDGSEMVGQAALGQVQITAPLRVFSLPAVPHRLEARMGEWVALVGYDAPEQVVPGQVMPVTLVWQALGETERDYKVFVHLLDAHPTGRMIVGSDAVPVNWTRPTPGWITGEYITDSHMLALPPDIAPGNYWLEVGMYEVSTGMRLGECVLSEHPVLVVP